MPVKPDPIKVVEDNKGIQSVKIQSTIQPPFEYLNEFTTYTRQKDGTYKSNNSSVHDIEGKDTFTKKELLEIIKVSIEQDHKFGGKSSNFIKIDNSVDDKKDRTINNYNEAIQFASGKVAKKIADIDVEAVKSGLKDVIQSDIKTYGGKGKSAETQIS